MPVSHLPECGQGHAALGGHLLPQRFAGRKSGSKGGKHRIHSTHYPYPDTHVKHQTYPHAHSHPLDNGDMGRKTLRSVLAKNVAERMERSGLDTQPKLATRAGVSQSHISRLLNQETGVSIDVLVGLALAFDCQPWELLVDDDATREQAIRRILKG